MAVNYTNAATTEIPAYIQAGGQQLLETVGGTYSPDGTLTDPGLIDQPYQTYAQGNPDTNQVVDQDALQLNAYQSAGQGIGAYEPYMGRATEAAVNAGNFNTALPDQPNVGAAAHNALLTGTGTGIDSLSTFQNPYQQDVIDATTSEMDRAHTQDMVGLDARAAQSGAFGGSRHGVAEAEAMRNHETNRTNAVAGLNQAGFDTATANNEAYLGRNVQGGQAMGNLGTNEANVNLDISRVEGGLGGLAQTYGINDTNMMATYGDRQQGYSQSVRDADVNSFYEEQAIPYQQAGFYSDMLNGVPSSSSTMTQSTSPNPSTLSQGIGAVGTYASIGNQFGWWGGDE